LPARLQGPPPVYLVNQTKPLRSLDAVIQRRQHALGPDRAVNPVPSLGTVRRSLVSRTRHSCFFAHALTLPSPCASTFLPPFPNPGLCCPGLSRLPQFGRRQGLHPSALMARLHTIALSRPVHRVGTTRALTPGHSPRTRVSPLSSLTLPRVLSSTTGRAHTSLLAPAPACVMRFRLRPLLAGSPPLPRRIRFVFLRTASSPPVAPHPASQRRSYLQLRGLWLTSVRTSTVLCERLHGRTRSRLAGEACVGEATAGIRLQAGSYGGAVPWLASLRARRYPVKYLPARPGRLGRTSTP
jgi:hypothetical protein